MNKTILIIITLLYNCNTIFSQQEAEVLIPIGIGALSFVAANAENKELAKEISQFRSKEFIVNYIIGPAESKEIKFEIESLASDNSAGLISLAFNCLEVNKKGLLLAFFGDNRNEYGVMSRAYAFRYIPLQEARELLNRIDEVKEKNKEYLTSNWDVNNVYIEYEDIKFVIYNGVGGLIIRTLWNGFEVEWEKVAFDRTKRRLNKWFQ